MCMAYLPICLSIDSICVSHNRSVDLSMKPAICTYTTIYRIPTFIDVYISTVLIYIHIHTYIYTYKYIYTNIYIYSSIIYQCFKKGQMGFATRPTRACRFVGALPTQPRLIHKSQSCFIGYMMGFMTSL